MLSVTSPGKLTEIIPPQLHISFEELFSEGMPRSMQTGQPGAHGAAVTGTQGMGVSTPKAAAVAEATVGLARLLHMPKVATFAIGLLSMIFAAGVVARMVGMSTERGTGATPKEHCSMAPVAT